jgi:hypothetical protein
MAHRELSNPSPFSCIGKERHETGQIAARVAKRMAYREKKADSYRCVHCDGWHIGRRGPGASKADTRRPADD